MMKKLKGEFIELGYYGLALLLLPLILILGLLRLVAEFPFIRLIPGLNSYKVWFDDKWREAFRE